MSAEGISLKVQVYSVFQGYLVLQHLQMMQIWIRLLPVCQVPSFPNLTLLASIFFPSLFPLGYLLYAVDIGGKINVSDMVSLSPYNPARNKWTQVKAGTLSIWMGMVVPKKIPVFLGYHAFHNCNINKQGFCVLSIAELPPRPLLERFAKELRRRLVLNLQFITCVHL